MAGGEVPRLDVGQGRANDDVGVAQLVAGDDTAHDGRGLPEDGAQAIDRLAFRTGGNVDGDHEIGTHLARRLDRHRAGQATIDVAAATELGRLEDARHGGRGAHGHACVAGPENHALAAVEIGGDRGEGFVQLFQRPLVEVLVDEILQRLALKQAAPAQGPVGEDFSSSWTAIFCIAKAS